MVCDNNTDYPSLSNIGLRWCKWWKHGDENVKENDKNQRNILYHNELEVNQMWNFDEYYLSTAYVEYIRHMPWFVKRSFWLCGLNSKHGDENVKKNDKNQRDIFDHNELENKPMWKIMEYYLSTTYIEYFSHMPWSGSLGSWLVALHFVIWWKHGDENVKENDKNQRDIFEHNELVVYSKIYCEKWYLYKI